MGRAPGLRLAAFSGAAACVLIAAPAAAQSAGAPPPGGGAVSEVIVTAQRRSERLNEVPIAITTQTAAQLERAQVTNVRDLTTVTPGLRFSGLGANAQPAIRGIHSDQTDPGNDPNVAVYLDGVYQSNQLANNMDLPDVERVEVLKGPQGTLFGRNATGGAIRIFTRAPSFTPTGFADLSYGNLDEFQARGFVSGPLVADKLAGSLSAYYLRRDGYATDVVTGGTVGGVESEGVRLKILARPTDDLDVTLTGAYSERHDGDVVAYQPLGGNTVGRTVPGAIITTEPRQVAFNAGRGPNALHAQSYMGALNVEWRLPAGTLTSTSAYNFVKADYTTDADFTQINLLQYPIFERQRDISQELTFSSDKFGIAQLVAGAFYYNGDGRYDPLIVEGATPTLFGYLRQETEAYAVFGELTLTPTERLSIILGARYSEESRRASGSYFLTFGRPSDLQEFGDQSFSSLTPRASIRYTFDSGDNVYFTYSRGFKSGGFNVSGVSPDPFDPEKVDAFEIGLKTSPRRPISGNFSAFYYKYKDQQVASNVNGFNVTSNAASSNIYGVDADVTVRPMEGLTVTAGASLLDAHFDQYPDAVFNTLSTAEECAALGGVPPCGNQTTVANLNGTVEPYSPKFTLGVTGAYHRELAAGGLDLSASVYRTSRFYFDNNARVGQPAYTTLSARAAFQPTGTNLSVYVYGRNLTDTRYLNTTFISNLGDGGTWALPRTYGIGLRYQF